MENEQQIVTEEPKVTAPQKATGKVEPHISNPFTTTLIGIKKVFRYNTNALIGTVLFNLVVGALMVITLLVVLGALLAFLITNPGSQGLFVNLPPQVTDVANSLSGSGIYASWIIGLILLIFFAALLQTVQLKLVTASSASQAISFGSLFKQGLRRVGPLIGLTALIMLIFIAVIPVLLLLGTVVGPIIFILGIITFVAIIYFGVRLSFAAFSVVGENLGPIASIKRSFELTKGHFAEILGVVAAVSIFVVVPTTLLELLALVSGPAEGVIRLVSAVAGLIIGTLAIAGFAERFVQLRNIKDGLTTATKTHVSNYLAIVAFILLSAIVNTITPENNNLQENNPYFDSTQIDQQLKDLEGQQDLYNQDESTKPSYNLN